VKIRLNAVNRQETLTPTTAYAASLSPSLTYRRNLRENTNRLPSFYAGGTYMNPRSRVTLQSFVLLVLVVAVPV
jgi:hypothetical protein